MQSKPEVEGLASLSQMARKGDHRNETAVFKLVCPRPFVILDGSVWGFRSLFF